MDEQTAKALEEMSATQKEEKTTPEPKAEESNVRKQPQPEIMDYNSIYGFSDLFIEHLKLSLKNIPHYKAFQYVDYVEKHKDGISLIDLNGFIKKLDMLEYGYINGLMHNIKNPEAQKQYFHLIKSNENVNGKQS